MSIEQKLVTLVMEYNAKQIRDLRKELKQDIRSYVDHAIQTDLKQDIRSYVDHAIAENPSDPDYDRHGDIWTAREDRELKVEATVFLTSTAYNHKRTEEAIRRRLQKQRLLW